MKSKKQNSQPKSIPNEHKPFQLTEKSKFLDSSYGYQFISLIGSGAFGSVFRVSDSSGRQFSIKKVIQNPNFKNRELSILSDLNHPNIIYLYDYYFTKEGFPSEIYLHLVTPFFPMDLFFYCRHFNSPQISMIKIFSYQLFCALTYLHSLNICHRDIKPKNLLIDPCNGILQICDFGSAKVIIPQEPSVSYIATRNYRAPELIYGSTTYGSSIDIWASGCVIAEMFLSCKQLFCSDSNTNLIFFIAELIGSPTENDLIEMNSNLKYNGPLYQRKDLSNILINCNDIKFINLLEKIFVYSPLKRLTAMECVKHPCFDPIRNGEIYLPHGVKFVPPANEKTNFGKNRNFSSKCKV